MVSVNMYITLCGSAEDHGLRDCVAFHIPWKKINAYNYGFRISNPIFKSTT